MSDDTQIGIFPPDWGWDHYEEATKELAAQHARAVGAADFLTQGEQSDLRNQMMVWMMEQRSAGNLPSAEEEAQRSDAYSEIYTQLLGNAQLDLEAGSLDGGFAHYGDTLEKHDESFHSLEHDVSVEKDFDEEIEF